MKRFPSFFWRLLGRRKSPELPIEINQQLVYTLAPSKIPNQRQLQHLKKFLNPKENLIIKICVLVILINAIFLAWRFYNKHLVLSPASGGEYSEGVVGYPKTINPLYASNRDVDSDLSYLIYSRLFSYDSQGRLRPDLAANMELSPDGKEYTVKLKEGVKWHDHESLDADDVIFTFALIQDPEFRSALRSSLDGVSIEKIDDLTVKFILPQSYAAFANSLTFGILPEHVWSNVGPSAATVSELNLKPIGSGPFKFQSLSKNKNGRIKEYRLERNDDYYDRPPYLENIVFEFFPDINELVSAFNDGQVDGLSYIPLEFRKELLAQNSLVFHELKLPKIKAIFLNQAQNKSLANAKIRQALLQGIDRQALISDIFGDSAWVLNGPIPVSSPFYKPDLNVPEYNSETAANLLKEALTVTTVSGRGAKKTSSTEVGSLELKLSAVDTSENQLVAQKIKSDWEKIGVKVALEFVSPEAVSSELIRDKNYQALLYGEQTGADPDIYAFWHSSQAGDKGLNLANYNSSEADKILESGRANLDYDSRLAQYRKLQELIVSDIPAIFLYNPGYSYVHTKKLKGFQGEAIVDPADRFSSIDDWYLKTKKKLVW